MRNKMKKVKAFVKNHKAEIAIATVTVISAGIAIAICKKTPDVDVTKIVIDTTTDLADNIDIPELEIGRIDQLWREDGFINSIVNDVTLADLGEFGKELIEKIDGLTENTVVTAMMGFINE